MIEGRPEQRLTDGPVNPGYCCSGACAIAERVCGDQGAGGVPAAMTAMMTSIIRQSPPSR
jgi:hypothetical protein